MSVADVDRELAAARKTYNERSSSLFACYNSKIKSELGAAGKRFRAETKGATPSQRQSLQATHNANRQAILKQWEFFTSEQDALLRGYTARTAALSAARRSAMSGRCADPWGETSRASEVARQNQIKDVKAKLDGHDRVLQEHAGRRARNVAQLQDIKAQMRALFGDTGLSKANAEFKLWFAENSRIGVEYDARAKRFSPDLLDGTNLLLGSFKTGLTLVTKNATLPEKNRLVSRFNAVAADVRSLDRESARITASRQERATQLAKLQSPTQAAATPVRAGSAAFEDPAPASRCRG